VVKKFPRISAGKNGAENPKKIQNPIKVIAEMRKRKNRQNDKKVKKH